MISTPNTLVSRYVAYLGKQEILIAHVADYKKGIFGGRNTDYFDFYSLMVNSPPLGRFEHPGL